jgi:hypothetical protein
MSKYQPKHAKPKGRRGNEHTFTIHAIAFFASLFLTDHFMQSFVTLNIWASLARAFGFFIVAEFVFACALALFAIWNGDRQRQAAQVRIAERRARRGY